MNKSSFSNLQSEHIGVGTTLNLYRLSFRYEILFRILCWKERNDDSIVVTVVAYRSFRITQIQFKEVSKVLRAVTGLIKGSNNV